MKAITENIISKHHAQLWAEAESQYGTEFAVPKDELSRIGEIIRGLYVVQTIQRDGASGRSALTALTTYSVSEDAIRYITSHFGKGESGADEKSETRKDKWGAFHKWAKEHRGEQFTTEQLVEQSGFSYQTTLRHVSESPLFTKVKKGLWQVASTGR